MNRPEHATSQPLSERESLELLEHVSRCRSRCPCSLCQYPNCLELKRCFRHALLCKVSAHGGCVVCRKLWFLIRLHARACKESECRVPHCKNMKEHLRKTAPSDFLNEGPSEGEEAPSDFLNEGPSEGEEAPSGFGEGHMNPPEHATSQPLSQLSERKLLELLVHVSRCRCARCQHPNCRAVKGVIRHGLLCKVHASGGCVLCKKMWDLVNLHGRACTKSICLFPYCKKVKEHLRGLTIGGLGEGGHKNQAEHASSKSWRQRILVDLLEHASLCASLRGCSPCYYPNCRELKGLFRHFLLCNVRAAGGCVECKKMWYTVYLHAQECKESECIVPYCKDVKGAIEKSATAV